MDLSFLNDINLGEAKVSAQSTGGKKVNLQPEKGDIRVFRNGRIYFSDEFRALVNEGGIDFVDSRKWNMYPSNAPKHVVFMCIVPKEKLDDKKLAQKVAAKLDVRQESTTSPIAAVRDRLIPMLKDIYGVDTEAPFFELKMVQDTFIVKRDEEGNPKKNAIYTIPKIVSSGENKGEDTYVRRENVTFYPLIVVETEPVIVDDAAQEANISPADDQQDTPFIAPHGGVIDE